MHPSRSRQHVVHRIRMLLPAALLLAAACEESSQPLTPELPSASTTSTETQIIQGETGPGALYEIHVPAAWNGDLVLYAHGIRDPRRPVSLEDQDGFYALRDSLVKEGYAFAYSSYSENGVAFKDAALRTHQLRGIFAAEVADPERAYLAGHSLGGVVTLMLAERYPAQYAGALTMCGQVAGTQATVDYFAHIRVLFDYFYPGTIDGSAMDVEGVDLQAAIAAAADAMATRPEYAGAIAYIMAGMGTPIPFIPEAPQTLGASILYALGFNIQYLPDLMDRTHGHSPFDNTATQYYGPYLDPALLAHLNANVDRFSATPDARIYLQNYYEPTGELHVPVLTLANLFDPVSAAFQEQDYKETVEAAGRSHLLKQTKGTAFPYGHCDFSTAETLSAFRQLVDWVEG